MLVMLPDAFHATACFDEFAGHLGVTTHHHQQRQA